MPKGNRGVTQKRIPKGHAGGGRWAKGTLGFGGALGKETDDAMVAFQEYRRTRVKLAKMKRRVGNNPSPAEKAQMAALAADVSRYKTAFDKNRKAALKNGVLISASGDVVAGKKQYAKAGKIIIQPASNVSSAQKKQATLAKQNTTSTQSQKTLQQQIDDGIAAFKEHRKWRVKVIQLNAKGAKATSQSQLNQINAQIQQATQKRDAAKRKLNSIRQQLNATGSVKFKANGDVVVNGTQTHKGGTPVGQVKAKAKKRPPPQSVAKQPAISQKPPVTPLQSSSPKRPPRRFVGAYALQRAHKFMSKHYGMWLNQLTNVQVDALRDYIGFPSWMRKPGKDPKFYDKLNRALVGERPMTAKIKKVVKHIDAALKKTATPYDLIVHRGLNSQTVYNAVKNGKFDNTIMNTAKATKRFISTSLEPDTAKAFMRYKPGVGFVPPKHPVYMEIEVPKGSKGAPLSFQNRFQNPYAANSSEFLLPRGTQFNVVESRMINEPGIGKVAYIKARISSQP